MTKQALGRVAACLLLLLSLMVSRPALATTTVTEFCAHLGPGSGCSGAMWQPTLPQAYEYWFAQEVASGGASVAGCTRQVRWRSGFDPDSASGNIAEWSTCTGTWWQAAYNVARTIRTRVIEDPPPGCNPGFLQTMNTTVQWCRSGNPDSPDCIGDMALPPLRACVDNCMWDLVEIEAVWRSSVPGATGLHRSSADSLYRRAADSCTTVTPGFDPNAAPAPCPGFLGEIDGKPRCVGTKTNPLPTSGQTGRNTANVPEETGNPRAGTKPTSGPGAGSGGTGRTPVTGDGGPAGGPSGAAGSGTKTTPGTGTKTSVPGEEQLACGAPGQPPCKIDETGTPRGDGLFRAATDALQKAEADRNSLIEGIKGTADKNTGWGLVPSWLTPVACTPWNLGTFEDIGVTINLDICQYKQYIDLALNFVWVVFTMLATLGMVFSTTTGRSS